MISFVGAGPGAPDLITLRGARLLSKADVVVYAGSLVNPELLELCRKVYQSVLYLNEHTISKLQTLTQHAALAKTAGYSAEEVINKYVKLPDDVKKILSAYWIMVTEETKIHSVTVS